MQVVARQLYLGAPEREEWAVAFAYATRRVESIEAAQKILLEAVQRQPGAATIHYNLACYECQLGELAAAKSRLHSAFTLDKTLRAIALNDEDLMPLWVTIGE